MRVVIIGGSHAGIAAARHLKKIDPSVEVLIIERTNILGYMGSSLNLYLEGVITDLAEARTVTPGQLVAEKINVLLNTEVTEILPEQKEVVFSIKTGQNQTKDSIFYDDLILAMGSSQYQTDFSLQSEREITNYKTLPQAEQAVDTIRSADKIAIIGAGLIGFELVETLAHLKKEIYLVDRMDSVLFRYFDDEITQRLLESLPDNVHVILNSNVKEIQLDEKDNVAGILLTNEKILSCDAVVFAINPRPNISLVADHLAINMDGTLNTNEYLQTSDPAIYAVGDLVSIHFNESSSSIYVPLVTNAYRTGMIAASNILLPEKIAFPKVQRTVVTELFNSYLASTGINEEEAPYYGFQVSSVAKTYTREHLFAKDEKFELTLKLVFDQKSKQIMGGQLMTSSREQVEMINTLSTLITMQADLNQLTTMDFYFNPKLSLPLHFLNDLAMEGLIIQ
ncbi:FAD-dependent oxidoreductase [Tetragenococcus koreensis]|uniref:Oxidoreductase n=1 Tax=Tetragenococcus koreensis TaxID=290335 RepID=A0AAN4RKS5_9ENTE|nr:FAD-dependent oxidoreductase [Tetragenococcus koreensis]MCF1584370.1 FAD-dependent oxidoreductase [Tetragenococcus koreensis]MCF1613919.1 FAD-dependent oxidoreductase [Tetragenococcus koreensis]MCF1616110.1 FAD-dependent oxidoreductase [Tetragenococcus koreensis]MCF1618538.1 FAD-dependent oxidoreductase [Tetragenococcus koreensis]MCF1621175.1 FAD-dependent oxidoreductase [Tetragenococcus koreensis]